MGRWFHGTFPQAHDDGLKAAIVNTLPGHHGDTAHVINLTSVRRRYAMTCHGATNLSNMLSTNMNPREDSKVFPNPGEKNACHGCGIVWILFLWNSMCEVLYCQLSVSHMSIWTSLLQELLEICSHAESRSFACYCLILWRTVMVVILEYCRC